MKAQPLVAITDSDKTRQDKTQQRLVVDVYDTIN
jgi:hypothetical protein